MSAASPTSIERFKKLLPFALLTLLAVGGWLVWSNLPTWLSSPDPRTRVDVIVVPAGDPDARLVTAMRLLPSGGRPGAEIWVVPSGDGPVLHEPAAIKRYAEEAGHGDAVKVLPKRSRSLVRDARLIAARLERTNDARDTELTVAVLASPLEVARARLVFERETGSDVLAWRDGSRVEQRGWTGVFGEAGRVLATLAVLGPGTALDERGSVPLSLPLRALAGGIIVAVLLGYLCRPLARRLGLVATPRLWRAHTTPTPMLGGLAIILGLGGGIVSAGGVRLGALGAAAAAGVLVVAVVGLVDDIAGLGTRVRLLWAAGAGAAAWLLGLRAHVLSPGTSGGDLVDALFTILWFVGITHALNIFDNVDGATGGVAAVSAAGMAVSAALGGQYVVAVAAAALAGACIGYLIHNVHPARLFMGDMGALGLGFTLAALGLALRPSPAPPLSMLVPVLLIGIPIFDTVMVSIARVAAGSSPAVGGTDHTSHRLMARGMTVRQAAAFLWASQAALAAVAIVLARTTGAAVGAGLALTVAAGGVAALVVFLRTKTWQPPSQMEASVQVVEAVERAMRALRQLEEAVGEDAWRLSNPHAARSTKETLKRLERVHGSLERPGERPAQRPGEGAGDPS